MRFRQFIFAYLTSHQLNVFAMKTYFMNLVSSLLPFSVLASRPAETLPPASNLRGAALPNDETLRAWFIADYGITGKDEADVARLVSETPHDFIFTGGDNNYPFGAANTLDANIGDYYAPSILFNPAYKGPNAARGAEVSRFFPTLGNHDWDTDSATPYLQYFSLPDAQRYYQLSKGHTDFFALDSDPREPEGVSQNSTQAAWLQHQLALSPALWKIVFFHHSPFSNGLHGSSEWMQWPFAEWGASLVLSGHDHDYERFDIHGTPYVVCGLGGAPATEFLKRPGSTQPVFQYNAHHGACQLETTSDSLTLRFINVDGEQIDHFSVSLSHLQAASSRGAGGHLGLLLLVGVGATVCACSMVARASRPSPAREKSDANGERRGLLEIEMT